MKPLIFKCITITVKEAVWAPNKSFFNFRTDQSKSIVQKAGIRREFPWYTGIIPSELYIQYYDS